MTRHDRYLKTCRLLRNRYIDSRGLVVTHHNGMPTRYYSLEAMAAVKYLGCDPARLGVPGLEAVRVRPVK